MSNSNNPKSFYNQAEYTPASGSSGNNIHKPDEISTAEPPPPYSPNQRKSSDSQYGSTSSAGIDQEQQVGLLSQQTPHPFLTKKKSATVAPNAPTLAPSINPHQELNRASMPIFIHRQQSNNNRNPGYCRKWCKYLFVVLLIWLVLFIYSGKIDSSPPPHSTPPPAPSHPPATDSCLRSDLVVWESLPRVIEFERNIELVLEGTVSGGCILVTPLEDRHGGSIVSDIQFTPSQLKDAMSFEIIQEEKRTTRLLLKMPQLLDDKHCIELNVEIRIPYSADLLRIHVNNVDVEIHEGFKKGIEVVDIKTINGDIELKTWTGENIELSAVNGNIKAEMLSSDDWMDILSENGDISFTSYVIAKHKVNIVGSNGKVIGEKIQADDTVEIKTSAGAIQLESVMADNVVLENANAGITVAYVQAKEQVAVKTSNAPITLSVAGEKNNKVVLSTSNNLVNLHMTSEFEGHFEMSTSNGEIKVTDDTHIVYQDNTRHLKRGDRLGYGNKGELTITNSNADIYVSFDV